MEKSGQKPKGQVRIKWSANFAYAIGLLVTDGCLYKNEIHICFTSKDEEQINNFKKCLGLEVIKTGISFSKGKTRFAYRVQFGDVLFYRFLFSIDITPHKSKTMGEIKINKKYFFDFLRGCFDGDGCFYSYWDPRWKSSHMFYVTFSSASRAHVLWLQKEITQFLDCTGYVSKSKRKGSIYNLRYAKKESLAIIEKMYYNRRVTCLSRKIIKIEKALAIEKKQQKLYSL